MKIAGYKREDDCPKNQPASSSRGERLGENYYRRLRDSRYAEEIPTDEGDEAIVDDYASFQNKGRKDVMLFSNDRDFIKRAHASRILAQRVEFLRRCHVRRRTS